MSQIASISPNAFLGLHHALAYTILPNGENAHCTVKPPLWYYDLFCKFYKTPYPLQGRLPELSAMITFEPSIDFLRKYHDLLNHKPSIFIICFTHNTHTISPRKSNHVSFYIHLSIGQMEKVG